MQKSWSSSFLWPIHPTQPHAQSSSKAGAGCLPQGSTATQTSASFLIQDKILNALKTKSGQHLGAKLRNASSEFLCSLLHTQNLGCPSDATQIVLPIPRFVQSLLPTPASIQFWFGALQFGSLSISNPEHISNNPWHVPVSGRISCCKHHPSPQIHALHCK